MNSSRGHRGASDLIRGASRVCAPTRSTSPCARVPDTSAVEKEKSFSPPDLGRPYASVQARDAFGRRRQQPSSSGIVSRAHFPVGEERERKVAIRIGQIVDFQALDLLRDLGVALVSRVGTPTRCADPAGTPSRSASLGIARGAKQPHDMAIYKAVASSEAGTSASSPSNSKPIPPLPLHRN